MHVLCRPMAVRVLRKLPDAIALLASHVEAHCAEVPQKVEKGIILIRNHRVKRFSQTFVQTFLLNIDDFPPHCDCLKKKHCTFDVSLSFFSEKL